MREFDQPVVERTLQAAKAPTTEGTLHATKPKADDKKAALAAEKKAAPATEKAKKEPTEKQKAQQERMKGCNDKASDKKGDERKKFMSSCLKGEDEGASDKQKAQQNKMTSCNKEAGDKKMKGDDRKAFMKDCLSTKK